MLCKHNDCGWCYAPELSDTNAKQGQCNDYSKCPEYKTLKDGWNIECSMEPVSPLDACANVADDEYDISQHSAEEVAESTISKVETVAADTYRYKIIINGDGRAPINGQTYLNFPAMTTEQQNDLEDYALNLVGPAPAEPEAWNGEGLPPVDTLIEVRLKSSGSAWHQEVAFIDEHCVVFYKGVNRKGTWHASMGDYEFRPIISQEQKAEREREELIQKALGTFESCKANHGSKAAINAVIELVKREAASDEG